jgi:hypothetical protein
MSNVSQLFNQEHETGDEVMMLIGNAEGKLHVQRQVEDYMLRGSEFERMGFLTFTVETYDRRITTEEKKFLNENDDFSIPSNENCRYLPLHPKRNSHIRVCRSENRTVLPNIIGPWFPRRDGDESTRPYYYASMLAILKPWRNLDELKSNCATWEEAFTNFMEITNQRDKDVVAGCQYYYESKSIARNREYEDEKDVGKDEREEDNEDVDLENELQRNETVFQFVSVTCTFFWTNLKVTYRIPLLMMMLFNMKKCKGKIRNIGMVS